jgi:hypothetical protein
LSPKEVVSISVGGEDISSTIEKENAVSALRGCIWHFRTKGLGEPQVLVLRVRSGRRVEWRLYEQRDNGSVVITLWDGSGISLGEVACPAWAKAASHSLKD